MVDGKKYKEKFGRKVTAGKTFYILHITGAGYRLDFILNSILYVIAGIKFTR